LYLKTEIVCVRRVGVARRTIQGDLDQKQRHHQWEKYKVLKLPSTNQKGIVKKYKYLENGFKLI